MYGAAVATLSDSALRTLHKQVTHALVSCSSGGGLPAVRGPMARGVLAVAVVAPWDLMACAVTRGAETRRFLAPVAAEAARTLLPKRRSDAVAYGSTWAAVLARRSMPGVPCAGPGGGPRGATSGGSLSLTRRSSAGRSGRWAQRTGRQPSARSWSGAQPRRRLLGGGLVSVRALGVEPTPKTTGTGSGGAPRRPDERARWGFADQAVAAQHWMRGILPPDMELGSAAVAAGRKPQPRAGLRTVWRCSAHRSATV